MVGISIGMLMVVGLMSSVTTTNAFGDRLMAMALQEDAAGAKTSMARASGQEKLKELRRMPFTTVSSGRDTRDKDGLRRTWTIIDSPSTPDTKSAHVRIDWIDRWDVHTETSVMAVLHR